METNSTEQSQNEDGTKENYSSNPLPFASKLRKTGLLNSYLKKDGAAIAASSSKAQETQPPNLPGGNPSRNEDLERLQLSKKVTQLKKAFSGEEKKSTFTSKGKRNKSTSVSIHSNVPVEKSPIPKSRSIGVNLKAYSEENERVIEAFSSKDLRQLVIAEQGSRDDLTAEVTQEVDLRKGLANRSIAQKSFQDELKDLLWNRFVSSVEAKERLSTPLKKSNSKNNLKEQEGGLKRSGSLKKIWQALSSESLSKKKSSRESSKEDLASLSQGSLGKSKENIAVDDLAPTEEKTKSPSMDIKSLTQVRVSDKAKMFEGFLNKPEPTPPLKKGSGDSEGTHAGERIIQRQSSVRRAKKDLSTRGITMAPEDIGPDTPSPSTPKKPLPIPQESELSEAPLPLSTNNEISEISKYRKASVKELASPTSNLLFRMNSMYKERSSASPIDVDDSKRRVVSAAALPTNSRDEELSATVSPISPSIIKELENFHKILGMTKSAEKKRNQSTDSLKFATDTSSIQGLDKEGTEEGDGEDMESMQEVPRTIILQVMENYENGDLICKKGDFLVATPSDRPGFYQGRSSSNSSVGLIPETKCRKVYSLFAQILSDATQSMGQAEEQESDAAVSGGTKGIFGEKIIKEADEFMLNIEDINSSFEKLFCPANLDPSVNNPLETMTWCGKVGLDIANGFGKQERARQEAIFEFIETEKAYLRDMQVLWENAIQPIIKSRHLSEEELVEVFSNFGEIVLTSKKLCKEFIQRVKSSGHDILRFGDLLVDKLESLKVYASYCSNLSFGLLKLEEKRQENQSFDTLVQTCFRNACFRKMDLNSYMLKPMQRVTKYPLLVKAVVKNTDAHHPDNQDITKAETVIQNVVGYINLVCGKVEERNRMVQLIETTIQPLLSGYVEDTFFSNVKKKYVYSVTVIMKNKPFRLFLFQDHILWVRIAKMTKLEEKYKFYKPPFDITQMELIRNPPKKRVKKTITVDDHDMNFVCSLYYKKESVYYDIKFPDSRAKEEFVNNYQRMDSPVSVA